MSPSELKTEACRLFPLTGMGKRACFRAFGVPYETGREWIDPEFPKKCPREDFVLWLSHIVAAKSLVRVA